MDKEEKVLNDGDVTLDDAVENEECKGEDIKADEQTVEANNIMEDENSNEINRLKAELEKKENEVAQYVELAQRVKAEFDNYKRRTAKEKEQLYTDIAGDIISKFLPVMDNLERAVATASEESDIVKLIEGLNMTVKQFKEIITKEGVEEIEALGCQFDPNFHNAVMHVEDEAYGFNEIVEVFQKGYKIKDKVLRYSVVKVAN